MFIVLKQLETALRAMKNYIDKFRPKYIRLEWDNEQNKPILNTDLRSIVEMIEDGIEVIFIIPSNNIPDYNEFNYIRFIRKNTYGEIATYVFKGELIFPWGEPKKEIELMIDHHIQDDIYNYTLSLDYGRAIYINGQLINSKNIQINIPEKVSDLQNDSGYITEANISKSDWNQNDSTANDYIKNRICYVSDETEEIELLYDSFNEQHNYITGTIIFPKTILSLENIPYTAILGDSNGIENQDYTVYTGTFTYNQQQQVYQFGDLSNFNIGESNGDPFYGTIDNMGDGGGYTITLTTSVSESTPFKLSITVPIVNTLDNKYLNGELLIRGDGIGSVLLNGENAQLRASGKYAVAEGFLSNAAGNYSHAEGGSIASGYQSHSEGGSIASGYRSHSEGFSQASQENAHAEGYSTSAIGSNSHSEGTNTIANHKSQSVSGEFNIEDSSTAASTARGNYVEIVGNGTENTARSNARTLDWSGNQWLAGNLKVGGTGYDDVNAKTVITTNDFPIRYIELSLYENPDTGEQSIITDLTDENVWELAQNNTTTPIYLGKCYSFINRYSGALNDIITYKHLDAFNDMVEILTLSKNRNTNDIMWKYSTENVPYATSSDIPTKVSDLTNDSGFVSTEIDDTAGTGDTNLTWSADKITAELASVESVQDVQINGTSIVNSSTGEANIPIASNGGRLGVVTFDATKGVGIGSSGNAATIVAATSVGIKTGTHDYNPIVPSHQHESVFYGLAKAAGDTTQASSSNAVGTYTDNAKSTIKTMLGVTDPITYSISILNNIITLTGSDGSTSSVTLPVYTGGVS